MTQNEPSERASPPGVRRTSARSRSETIRRSSTSSVLFVAIAVTAFGCTSTPGSRPPSVHAEPLRVEHVHAEPDADPMWDQASETLEHLSIRCDERRHALERRAETAREESGIASVVAVVVTIIGEVADTTPPTTGVLLGQARCSAPSGPTTTLPPDQQQSAIPCGGMAASGGGGPIPQRAIRRELNLEELTAAMRDEIEASLEWLRVRRELEHWTDDDTREWGVHEANLRSLCIE